MAAAVSDCRVRSSVLQRGGCQHPGAIVTAMQPERVTSAIRRQLIYGQAFIGVPEFVGRTLPLLCSHIWPHRSVHRTIG